MLIILMITSFAIWAILQSICYAIAQLSRTPLFPQPCDACAVSTLGATLDPKQIFICAIALFTNIIKTMPTTDYTYAPLNVYLIETNRIAWQIWLIIIALKYQKLFTFPEIN